MRLWGRDPGDEQPESHYREGADGLRWRETRPRSSGEDALRHGERERYYAGWASYDDALRTMTPAQRYQQARAEVVELFRWWAL